MGFCFTEVKKSFTVIGLVERSALELQNFKTAAWYFFWLGEGLNLFDLVVIDLCWWRNTKRIRFSCVPEKEAYQNPKKHVGSFLRGIPMFASGILHNLTD